MATNSLVTVRNLHTVFQRGGQRIDVLQGVNLDIPEGDYLTLMGPSGSGKTTLLNLIGGLDTPTEGSIDVAGGASRPLELPTRNSPAHQPAKTSHGEKSAKVIP